MKKLFIAVLLLLGFAEAASGQKGAERLHKDETDS